MRSAQNWKSGYFGTLFRLPESYRVYVRESRFIKALQAGLVSCASPIAGVARLATGPSFGTRPLQDINKNPFCREIVSENKNLPKQREYASFFRVGALNREIPGCLIVMRIKSKVNVMTRAGSMRR